MSRLNGDDAGVNDSPASAEKAQRLLFWIVRRRSKPSLAHPGFAFLKRNHRDEKLTNEY
jgi:hypothetical protein